MSSSTVGTRRRAGFKNTMRPLKSCDGDLHLLMPSNYVEHDRTAALFGSAASTGQTYFNVMQ